MKKIDKPNRVLSSVIATIVCFGVITSNGQAVAEDRVIVVGGIKQFVHVESDDARLPVLLFLHGGPGGSVMLSYKKWSDQLVKNFVLIQWDQRETGKTLELNASPEKLTVQLFKDDASEMIDSVLKIYNKKKLYIVGHSWGTVLGFHVARSNPQKLHGFVAVGPMVNQLESERISLAMMLQKAKESGDLALVEELESVKIPFENGHQLYVHRKNLFAFAGNKRPLDKTYVLNWSTRWLDLYNRAASEDLNESTLQLACPIWFFLGRKDYQTNSKIAEAYFSNLNAPLKRLIWFEKSAHGIPTSEPQKFQAELIKILSVVANH